MKIKKRNQDQNHGVEKLVGDSCVQYTLALQRQKSQKKKKMIQLKNFY